MAALLLLHVLASHSAPPRHSTTIQKPLDSDLTPEESDRLFETGKSTPDESSGIERACSTESNTSRPSSEAPGPKSRSPSSACP